MHISYSIKPFKCLYELDANHANRFKAKWLVPFVEIFLERLSLLLYDDEGLHLQPLQLETATTGYLWKHV